MHNVHAMINCHGTLEEKKDKKNPVDSAFWMQTDDDSNSSPEGEYNQLFFISNVIS